MISDKLYILNHGHWKGVLAPDANGVPTIVSPEPIVIRAAYMQLNALEAQLASVSTELRNAQKLLLFGSCPDGPPYRSGCCFTYTGMLKGVMWSDGITTHPGADLQVYEVTTAAGPWTWLSDYRQGKSGYFATGDDISSTLWRLFRLESNVLNHSIFTIAPVRFTAWCPMADFSSVNDAHLVAELNGQYQEFCQSVVQNAYRDVVTKARNIVEAIVAVKLGMERTSNRDRLYDGLKVVYGWLNDKEKRATCGWTDLQYHLAQKIRLAHGRTHPSAKPLRPEFAMAIVEDLLELLVEWGFVPNTQ